MMDADKQQQLEMFLGLKPQQYLASTRLPYRDDPGLPLDYPETDDEEDAVGLLSFPLGQGQDKRGGGTALAEYAGRPGGERQQQFGKSASQGNLGGGGELQHLQHLQQLGAMKHGGGTSDGDLLLLDDEMGSGRAAQRSITAGEEAGRGVALQAVRPLSDPLGLL
jgi:hypothetical protein